MLRSRCFYLKNKEIIQLVNAENSDDDENNLKLDEEDIAFLESSTDLEPGTEIHIEDVLASAPVPSENIHNEQSTSQGHTLASYEKENLIFRWRTPQENYLPPVYMNPDYGYGNVLNPIVSEIEDMPSILNVFNAVCNFDVLLDAIRVQSELYCHQKGILFSITLDELKAFMGIVLVMTIHKLPEIRLYWSTLPIYAVPIVSNVMTRVRFEEIRANLHFADNEGQPSRTDPTYDRAYKIRPVIKHFNQAFKGSLTESKYQSIDEHMIKFTGHNIMKQYMKDKPIPWGFKMWCRCDGETGYLHKFDIYSGKKDKKEVGIGESVVLNMVDGLENKEIEVYFDNFFNSPMLLQKLKIKGIRACGTIRSNRTQMPKNFPKDREMKRGDFKSFESDGVSVVKWMDNRAVHIASNFVNPNEKVYVKRRQVGSAEKINIVCPKMVQKYNKGMSGVDLMDQKKSYYEYDRKSKTKFYLRLFFDMLDLAVLNSQIVFNKISAKNPTPFSVSLLEFRSQLATQLINSFSSRIFAAPMGSIGGVKRTRFDAKTQLTGHYITKMENRIRKRCVVCTKEGMDRRTNSFCAFCKKPFCYTNERNCFEKYHSKPT